MASERRTRSAPTSPMLHFCIIEECTTIVFGVGPCVEHERRRVPLAEQLLAEAVAAAQQEQANAEAAVGRPEPTSPE